MTTSPSRRPRTLCLLVLTDWMMMEDVAEGLAEIAPNTDIQRATSPDAALELLATLPRVDYAIIDAPGESTGGQRLCAQLVEQGTSLALVAHDGVSVSRAHFPVLDRPFGYSELQSFLIEMLKKRQPVRPPQHDCALQRPSEPPES
ncbi:hypothetical protein [Pararhodobacter zhoushanensis]|uniref:hypothetical protein n=1 Tax=Pararhodobacter zhoushanensis TaxID=2479545 RepID=UPI000F8D28F2|nr:hypothetical protein [Pararhodobacter zhoushanensis]